MRKRRVLGGVRFFWGFLSLATGGTYEAGYNRKEYKVTQSSSQIEKDFFQMITSTLDQNIRVIGNIGITGNNMIPTEANVYIEIMRVSTKTKTRDVLCGNAPMIINPYTGLIVGNTDDPLTLFD